MRMSVHDPVMPVNIESAVPGGCKRIAAALLNALQLFDGLDLEPLQAVAGITG